jgi:hypothetical protein
MEIDAPDLAGLGDGLVEEFGRPGSIAALVVDVDSGHNREVRIGRVILNRLDPAGGEQVGRGPHDSPSGNAGRSDPWPLTTTPTRATTSAAPSSSPVR